jgi:hypothetical protein
MSQIINIALGSFLVILFGVCVIAFMTRHGWLPLFFVEEIQVPVLFLPLDEVFEEVTEDLRAEIADKAIHLKIKFQDDIGEPSIDSFFLRLKLRRLLDQAIENSTKGTSLIIRARQIEEQIFLEILDEKLDKTAEIMKVYEELYVDAKYKTSKNESKTEHFVSHLNIKPGHPVYISAVMTSND